jgi:tRNA G18 (ribose-2'-O)-methylase SpoU
MGQATAVSGTRDREGFIVLEGAFLVERALAAGLELEELYCVPNREAWARALVAARGSRLTILAEGEIAEIAGYAFHRGVYALARRPKTEKFSAPSTAASGSTMLVLPETSDPENLGAAFRNAAAFGCDALLLGPSGPDPLCRRVLRVSMGASLSLPWARLEGPSELEALSGSGYVSAACVLDPRAEDLRSWCRPRRLALVIGNEAQGLSPSWLGACSHRITLPMRGGADSLNAATAAAVFLYALSSTD